MDSGETWTQLANGSPTPTVSAGDVVMWKGSNHTLGENGIGTFSATTNFDVAGNAMSLHFGDNFENQTSLSGKDYAFKNLFSGCSSVIDAENLELPATTLSNYCYQNMFNYAVNLTKVQKELPATTLAKGCYSLMFKNCSSLVTPPSEICGLAMENSCFLGMFDGCSAMTTAPVISATRINRNSTNCCTFMFRNCSSLETVPNNMLSATALTNGCYAYMFQGCTKMTTAPMLPAPTLNNGCYQCMFDGCSKLNSITCLATSKINSANCRYWVRGVASSGTFTKAASATWSTGNNGRPTNWTLVDYVG